MRKFKANAINKKIVISVLTIFLIVVGLFVIKEIIDYMNINSITYNSRTYNKSVREVNAKDMENIKTTIYTGKKAKGMDIYDVKDNPYNSTIIYLKTKEDKFLIYALSGGP